MKRGRCSVRGGWRQRPQWEAVGRCLARGRATVGRRPLRPDCIWQEAKKKTNINGVCIHAEKETVGGAVQPGVQVPPLRWVVASGAAVAATNSVCRGGWTSPRWFRSTGCALPLGDGLRLVLTVPEQRRSLTTTLHQRLRPPMQQHTAAKHRECQRQATTQRHGLLHPRVSCIGARDAIVLGVDKKHTHRGRPVQCTNLHEPTDAPVVGNGPLTRGAQQGGRLVSVHRLGKKRQPLYLSHVVHDVQTALARQSDAEELHRHVNIYFQI